MSETSPSSSTPSMGGELSILLEPLPPSPLFTIRETLSSGRGAFPNSAIAPGTRVLESPYPLAHVILQQFRHEVCDWCFTYDRGRRWTISHVVPDGREEKRGVAWFCSEECYGLWKEDMGELGIEAWCAVHNAFHVARKTRARANIRDVSEDELDPASSAATLEDLEKAWMTGCEKAATLVSVRQSSGPSKTEKRLVRDTHLATMAEMDEDDTLFLLSGILSISKSVSALNQQGSCNSAWRELLSLSPSLSPYLPPRGTPSALERHFVSLQLLLCLLPSALISHCTPVVLLQLFTRDAPNSFGIRSRAATPESEFLGYGLWPSASFFNHSCLPNVQKDLVGRAWVFTTVIDREIPPAEELRISYLGDNVPAEMDVQARQTNLVESWGFKCDCPLCVEELAKEAGIMV